MVLGRHVASDTLANIISANDMTANKYQDITRTNADLLKIGSFTKHLN